MIELNGVRRDFRTADRAVAALGGIDLTIERGTFLVLLGPSGSGKTTLLRSIAGLERPDDGDISIDGELVFSKSRRVCVPPEARRLGMVFQSYAVWPHMTVRENVSLPLRYGVNRIARDEVPGRVERALDAVQLSAMRDRPTTMLSGGQQQRVALARALGVEPRALLMDEPLSNLDARLREEIRHEIKTVVDASGVTVVYVTHDQDEAMALADEIAVMDAGRIVQKGTPRELYAKPANPRVAEFFGSMNWLTGTRSSEGRIETGIGSFAAPGGTPDGALLVGVRPEDITVYAQPPGRTGERPARVLTRVYLGAHEICRLKTGAEELTVKLPIGRTGELTEDQLWFEIQPERIHVFAAAPG